MEVRGVMAQFKAVALATHYYQMVIDAETKEEARKIVEESPEWEEVGEHGEHSLIGVFDLEEMKKYDK